MDYIKSDLCRYVGFNNVSFLNFIKCYFLHTGFRYSVWFRIASRSSIKPISFLAKVRVFFLKRKFFIDIPVNTQVGHGLYIGHGQNIVVNPTTIIGCNVNLSPFTNIGANDADAAVINNNVYIGPNVSIVENVILGTEVIIGAGAVVTKNIPSYSTAVGVPSKLIKTDITVNRYVNRRWNCKCNSSIFGKPKI